MRQAGVTEAPVRERRPRALVDFGVDETWAPARPTRTRTRRERQVDSWVDDADLFAPRYGDDLEPAGPSSDEVVMRYEDFEVRPHTARTERPPARVERPAVRGERSAERAERPSPRADGPAAGVKRPAARIERPAARGDRPPAGIESAETRVEHRAARGASAAPVERPAGRAATPARRRSGPHPGPFVVQTEVGAVSVDVVAHPAHVPAPPAEADPARAGATGAPAGAGVAGRRTVTIRGRGAERDLAFPEPGRARRPPVRRHERPGFKPDRAGLWALLLGVVLVLVAATSSHAATLSHARPALHSAARMTHVAAPPPARVLVVHARR